ncbi:hypothetical protein GEV27_08900 [Aeromicrobium sp. S22]|uniref:acyl-CoA dehydrogenase family protein n=1 Tax=Aeromicrobium sp. S22 TaxID=2662029 RepID=UPI00129DEFE4|nr:acyl-CoA dehydrogenase family protein [Aeromicrobium sp. S22]MRK01639.1 hypothetical protein [Aeromicrobium sp. S22]
MSIDGPAGELRVYLEKVMPGFRAEWGAATSFEAQLAWQKLLNEGGWAAPSWPVEHGGRGLSTVDRIACDAELARVDAPMAAGAIALQNIGPALMMFGTEEQQRSLPHILSGEEFWAQGFSEPGAGSDLAALTMRAELVNGEFVLNGQKVWTSNGMQSTHALLLVRTDREAAKHKGISALLVKLDSPGIERRPIKQITGESGFAEMFFHDVRVPEANLLGPLNQGWLVTMKTLGYERTGVINMATKLERDVREVVENTTVTDPILRDELLGHWMDARLVGLMGARALARLKEGEEPGSEQSIIKFGWSLVSSRLAETEMKVSGHHSLLADDRGTQRFLRSRSATIAAGTTEVMKNILAERVLGLPRD